MNKIINAINFIKCKYLITKENVNKEILIYTKEGWNNKIDKINILVDGELKSNMDKCKFTKEGIQEIYIIGAERFCIENLFKNCTYLKEALKWNICFITANH